MRCLYHAIWLMLLCQSLIAADSGADRTFNDQCLVLEKYIPSSKDKDKVFADLKKWDPDESSSLWRFPMLFRDRYLYDDSFRGEIRGYFLPSFFKQCYERIVETPVEFPAESVVRASEVGYQALRLVHKIPYMFCAEQNQALSVFPHHEATKTCMVIFSHMSALGSQACQAMRQAAGDPTTVLALYLASWGLEATSLLFTAATGYLSMDDDYIDVVLRSLRRSYEELHDEEKLAVTLEMIAGRARLKIEAKQD